MKTRKEQIDRLLNQAANADPLHLQKLIREALIRIPDLDLLDLSETIDSWFEGVRS